MGMGRVMARSIAKYESETRIFATGIQRSFIGRKNMSRLGYVASVRSSDVTLEILEYIKIVLYSTKIRWARQHDTSVGTRNAVDVLRLCLNHVLP